MDEREYERLDAFRRTLEGRVRENPSRYPAWMRDKRLSTGDTIAWLLDQQHAANRRRRKRAGNAACNEPPAVVDSSVPGQEG